MPDMLVQPSHLLSHLRLQSGLATPLWTSLLWEQNTVYFATQTPGDPRRPFSSITRLIQGIYEHFPEQARALCRNRVYSTQPSLTPLCRSMIKVAAKRVSLIHLNLESVSYEPVPDLKFVDLSRWDQHWDGDGALPTELPSGGTETLSAWMQITQNLAHAGTTSVQGPSSPAREEVPRSSRNRPVAALLLSPQPQTGQLQLLASAVNQNARNRTLHAEVNLIQNLYRRTGHLIPPHSYVLSSLKPCRMCAALIWQSAERIETLQILYGENDPGPHAQNTTLDPHTLDRKLASATPAQEALEIQRLLEDPSPKI